MIIVTGASTGIGASVALACAARGMNVALAARRTAPLHELAAEVEALGGKALVCQTDVTVSEQIDALAAATLGRFGRIDVLLANAGMGCHTPVHEADDEAMTATVNTNLLGVMRCVRAVLPTMLSQRSGHILTVSSVIVQLAWPNDAIYAATKAGVHRFTQGLRNEVEVRENGIRVTEVVPGVIDTPLTQGLHGLPKSDVRRTAAEIVGVIDRPRRVLVTPAWYRIAMAANVIVPGCIDAAIARRCR